MPKKQSRKLTAGLSKITNIPYIFDFRYIISNLLNRLRFQRGRASILIRVDQAKLYAGYLYVAGWAISQTGQAGIKRIEVYLDGQLIGNAVYGGMRSDVEQLYPGISQSNKSGFHFVAAISTMLQSGVEGRHVLVKAIGVDQQICATRKALTTSKYHPPGALPDAAIDRRRDVGAARTETDQSENNKGVNVVGDLRADFGLSDSARALVQAIIQSNFSVSYIETPFQHVTRTTPIPDGVIQGQYYNITLIHLNAPEILSFQKMIPPQAMKGKYVIGYWYWELSAIPDIWCQALKYLDEVWVASSFVQDAIARVANIPVVRIPLSVNAKATHARREDFDLPDDRCIFTYSFTPYSSVARKNPFAVIEAFRRAFGAPTAGPLLVIKVHHLENACPELEKFLYEALESVKGQLILKNYTRQEMYNYLSLCDCYVSLHRSEGFGLGVAESMALGKPVIATAYSGNVDCMRPDNSYQVAYTLREITPEDHEYQPAYNDIYPPGVVWAEPDLDHAAELMQRVYENQSEARHIGAKAQNFMALYYSPTAQANAVSQRLKRIAQFT